MPGTEADHDQPASDGTGPLPTGDAGGGEAGASDGCEPTAAGPAAGAKAATGPAAEPGNNHTRPELPADPADDADATSESLTASAYRDALEFSIAADITYNRARANWQMFCHRLMLMGAVVAGSTAASDMASVRWCALAAALCATLDLVFDPATSAATHRETTRALHDALIKLRQSAVELLPLREIEIELLRISALETAPYNALRALAHNSAVTGLGRDPSGLIYVPRLRRLISNLYRFEGWENAKLDQRGWLRRAVDWSTTNLWL